MTGLGLGLELELGLGLGPGFIVRVSRVSRLRVRVNVKARADDIRFLVKPCRSRNKHSYRRISIHSSVGRKNGKCFSIQVNARLCTSAIRTTIQNII